MTLGFLAGVWMASRLGRKAGLDSETVLNLGIYVALAALAGAKLLMILLDLGYYGRNPGEIFTLATFRAGGVFYGGLIAALITSVVYIRRKRLPGLLTADVFAPAIALGHAIGRLAQLYEAFAEAIIFLTLYWRFHRPHRPGALIGLYLVLYSSVRFLVEFVRAHEQANPLYGPLVAEQWLALALVAAGVWVLRRPAQGKSQSAR